MMIGENRHLADKATLNKYRKVPSEATTRELPILANHTLLNHPPPLPRLPPSPISQTQPLPSAHVAKLPPILPKPQQNVSYLLVLNVVSPRSLLSQRNLSRS